jgi:hypothetical protein
MKVGVRQINGVDTEVHADPHGMFQIQVDGKVMGSGNTLDAAITKARAEINRTKTKVEVKFITKDGERGVATGMHSRNRTILARIGDDKSEQLQINYQALSPDMPPAKLKRWLEIQDQLRTLQAEQRTLDNQYGIRLRERVEDAINSAQKKTLGGVTAAAAERRLGGKKRR